MIKFEDVQNMSDATKTAFDAVSKKGQAIAAEITQYTKRNFENNTKAVENLLGAKSLEKVVEVHSDYVKTAYQDCVFHANKLGELYTDLAKEAFRSYEVLARESNARWLHLNKGSLNAALSHV